MENVSRETSDEPMLFWRVCADDSSLTVEHKIRWLAASYQHVIMLAGLSMPAELIDKRIGVAAVMSRISDLLLGTAGTDAEIDKFIVKWLCFACDQLWEFVPDGARNAADDIAPDAPRYSAWLADMERRLPGLASTAKDEAGIGSRAGDEVLVIVCPACQTYHIHPARGSICTQCGAPLHHLQPIPYSTAQRQTGRYAP